jgi:hypothetical protein
MTYRIPTVPLRGQRPCLSAEQQEWLHAQYAQSRKRRGIRRMQIWADHLNVHEQTVSRYIRGKVKFPVRA